MEYWVGIKGLNGTLDGWDDNEKNIEKYCIKGKALKFVSCPTLSKSYKLRKQLHLP